MLPTLSHSSAKVEYRGIANAVVETCWLRNLLLAAGQVRVLHVPSRYQFAYIFTKGLPSTLFEEFRTSLSVRCPPAPTVGEWISIRDKAPIAAFDFHSIRDDVIAEAQGIGVEGTDGAMVPAGEPPSGSSTARDRKLTCTSVWMSRLYWLAFLVARLPEFSSPLHLLWICAIVVDVATTLLPTFICRTSWGVFEVHVVLEDSAKGA
ncbi:hypothetical protein Tco_0501962 [Tanacetum coccineum]